MAKMQFDAVNGVMSGTAKVTRPSRLADKNRQGIIFLFYSTVAPKSRGESRRFHYLDI